MSKYKIKLIWKCLTGEKCSFSAIKKIILTMIGYLTSVYTLSDFINKDCFKNCLQKHWCVFIISGFILSLIHNHNKISFHRTMTNDDYSIYIKINNLFRISATSYVIPTNTFFRTSMENEYISPNSVQGAFQNKYFKNNLKELDKKITDSLLKQKICGEQIIENSDSVTKYPIGTVAKVDHKKKHYYFVAINDVNEYGKPINQTYDNVIIAINGLLESISKMGHYDELAMPLIGTGKAAIKEATIDKVALEIIDRFIDSNDKIARKLTICISPKDYLDGIADVKKIVNYLDYKYEFKK